jgi:hypothetical protein
MDIAKIKNKLRLRIRIKIRRWLGLGRLEMKVRKHEEELKYYKLRCMNLRDEVDKLKEKFIDE